MRLEHWLYTVPLRLRSLFRRGRVERELDEELQYHLERQIEEYLAKGMTSAEARYAALRHLGGLEQRKEECRDMRRVNLIENSIQDLRYAMRILRRSPGFTLVAILSLALGIGANTAVFQLIDAVRLRSLPIAKPEELAEVRINGGNHGFGLRGGSNTHITNPLWEQIREHQEAFSGIFAWGDADYIAGEGADAHRVKGLMVSGDFFPVLGVSPLRGRLFNANDDRRGCGLGGVVISHAFWQRHFGGKDSAIGQTLMISDKPFQVIGVTPPEFFGLEVGKGFDIALSLCAYGNWDRILDRRDIWMLVVMGRLKPGWSLAQASSHLNAISPGMIEATLPPGYAASHLETYRSFRLMALPAGHGVSDLRENYETSLWLLLGMTGLVLLIACANLANLMLARASAREREISVRIALGASRGRLVRQMLSESLLLAGIGAALGVSLARVLSQTLISFLATEGDSLQLDLSLNWQVLAFTGSVAILTSIIFGLIPALRASHIDPGTVMKASGRGMTTNRERFSLQRFLIVGQIAISLVLLVGAMLFVRSFRNLTTLDAGFRQQGILIAGVDFGRVKMPAERFVPYQAEVIKQIREIQGVESAGSSTNIPLSGTSWTLAVQVQSQEGMKTDSSKFTYISPEYFKTMEIPLLSGRGFNDFDTTTSRKVAIVNETFVRQFFLGQNPLGALIRTVAEPKYPETLYEVIGVVKDTKYADLRDGIPPGAFVPAAQHPAPGPWVTVTIRSSAPLNDVIAQVRNRLGTMSPEIRIRFSIFEQQIREGLIQERLMAWLAGFFGALAAALAMIGLYGVISYMVLKRRNELGIRLALGASRSRIVLLVLRETLLLLLIGLILGTVASVAVAKGAAALLFNLSPYDLPTLIISILSLALVAGVASYLPAWRASRLNPVVALRHD